MQNKLELEVTTKLDKKQKEIMSFLHDRVFDPVLNSATTPQKMKTSIKLTVVRMEQQSAAEMVQYFCAVISGTAHSVPFGKKMMAEGFTRFEDVAEEFLKRFDDSFLKRKD